jgi:hypothetical protein
MIIELDVQRAGAPRRLSSVGRASRGNGTSMLPEQLCKTVRLGLGESRDTCLTRVISASLGSEAETDLDAIVKELGDQLRPVEEYLSEALSCQITSRMLTLRVEVSRSRRPMSARGGFKGTSGRSGRRSRSMMFALVRGDASRHL